jgi:hypothetical protein
MGRTARWREVVVALAVSIGGMTARADQVLELRLAAPPHAPGDAPDVLVHVPTHFDARQPLSLVIFLHGFNACARALLASAPTPCSTGGPPQRPYGLASLHEQAGTNTLLVVPQLAFLARKAGAPRFAAAGGFASFVDELLGALRDRLGAASPLQGLTLVAHSAGYRAAAQILADPSAPPVEALVLFDALYANWDVFAHWLLASPTRRCISLFTRDPQTRAGNQQLLRLVRQATRGAAGEPGGQPLHDRLVVVQVDTPHRAVPEQHLVTVLRGLFVTGDLRGPLSGAGRPNVSAR